MRKVFVLGIFGLLVLECANVYFIMPMPGSQRMRSIDWAYLVYSWRWPLRLACIACLVAGTRAVWRAGVARRVVAAVTLLAVSALTYVVNFRMAADQLFRQPHGLTMAPSASNLVQADRLVVGIEINGDARAYPLQFIGYHHQVRDTVGGQPILVSYCTVCRTGRVFRPMVNGRAETFRLVGMDHFNAMFEDRTTGSWWRQANGEAITGPLKGTSLTELPSRQVTLRQWLALYPASLIMQADSAFSRLYAKDFAYENGTSTSDLTGTDSASWHEKSWVVGITVNGHSKAYDWNRLRKERLVHDVLGGQPIVLALGGDNASFFAFQRPDAASRFVWRNDSLVSASGAYALNGHGSAGALQAVAASQEFWHSWRTFQPSTDQY